MKTLSIALLVSTLAFLFYGINCLWSQKMKDEFVRFGLNKQRVLTGSLQLLGAIGLAFGYFFWAPLAFFAALGLTLLMLAGFVVRIKIKDSVSASLPSLIFAIVNLYICIQYYYIIKTL